VGEFMMSDNPLKTIKRNARKAGTDVPDSLVDALIQQESGGDPDAVSSAGAVGLAQSMPNTARDPGYGVEPLEDPRDPEQARRFAEDYLGAMLDEFEDPGHALMAYNWGPGNVKRWKSSGADPSKVPEETRDYVKSLGPAAARSTGQEINTPFYSSGGGAVATAR
jgi:soluble lytic murein transglycosylase-like protein